MSFECLDCKAIRDGYCEDCATPNDDLRELINRWRSVEALGDNPSRAAENYVEGHERCAKHLEKVLEE